MPGDGVILDQQQEQLTLAEQIVYLFRDTDTEFTRFLSAIGMGLWSTILLLPGDTLGSAKNLAGLTRHGTDLSWGLILGAVALLIGISAPAMNLLRLPPVCRAAATQLHAVGLFLSMTWWLYLAWSIWLTNVATAGPPSTGLAAYPTFAIGAIWAFLRFMARHDVIRRRRD
jgi:hypothetical protein